MRARGERSGLKPGGVCFFRRVAPFSRVSRSLFYGMERNMKLISPSMLLILLLGVVVAQTNTGRISGRVTDITGAGIPGVTVTITDEGTNTTRAVRTEADGVYTATNLRAGVYSVKVEHPGFKKALKSGYDLVNDGRLSIDIKLETGDVSATVEVVS